MNNKILFLDFDGVLFDTLQEVYLINRCYYKNIDFLEKTEADTYKRFSKYKFLVYNIWMFYYYNPLIFENIQEDKIPEKFFEKINNRDLRAEEKFCEEFLKLREKLVRNHHTFWKNLEKPFEFFFEIKKIYEKKLCDILIISKKNKISILERFQTYDFDLNADNVVAREILADYSDKGEFINEYMLKNNYKQAIFVDDNMNNLKTNSNKNVENVLALWGNVAAGDRGYTQEEAIEKIKNFTLSN